MRPTFPLRANLLLRRMSRAFEENDLRRALLLGRAYFATRLPRAKLPLRGADIHVALLTAFAAAFFKDELEVRGAAALFADAKEKDAKLAAKCIEHLQHALVGHVADVFADVPAFPEPLWAELRPFALVIAVEQAGLRIAPSQLDAVRKAIKIDVGPACLRARAMLARAWLSTLQGDWEGLQEALQELTTHTTQVPLLATYLALLAEGRVAEALDLAVKLAPEDADLAGSYAARFLTHDDAGLARRALDAFSAHASKSTRDALVSRLALALLRHGDAKEAAVLLAEHQTDGEASSLLAIVTAHVALCAGAGVAAKHALRTLPRGSPLVLALHWAALAVEGDARALAHELGGHQEGLPEPFATALGPSFLATFAREGIAPQTIPAWLLPPKDAATAQYAFGVVRLWQGAAEEAHEALAHALSLSPDLAALGDAPEVARLSVASQRLAQGRTEGVAALLTGIQSARLAPVAESLEAFALVVEAARAQKLALSPTTAPTLLQTLEREAKPTSKEAALLKRARAELASFQTRAHLSAGKLAEARAAAAELGADDSAEGLFLHAVMDTLEGTTPLDQLEKRLRGAADRYPTHEGLLSLLAEVVAARGDVQGAMALLEGARDRAESPLLDQALSDFYREARRGLEAKRAGFAEMRKTKRRLDPARRSALSFILSLESPPRASSSVHAKVVFGRVEELLPKEGLADRAPLLFAHAQAAIERDPGLASDIEAAVKRLKLSLMSEDGGEAAAEMELVKMMGRRF